MARVCHTAHSDLEGPGATPLPRAPTTGSSNMHAASSHGNLTFALIQMNKNNMQLKPAHTLGQLGTHWDMREGQTLAHSLLLGSFLQPVQNQTDSYG